MAQRLPSSEICVIRGKITLAVGNPYHSSLTRLSPSEMVDEVIENILKLNTGATPETAKDL
jgi:hypothetical protein